MNITSNIIKRIADAGYKNNSDLFINCIWYGSVEIFEDRIFRLIAYGQKDLDYILNIELFSDGSLWIDTNGHRFDHIAAIKEMKDLGLIKID